MTSQTLLAQSFSTEYIIGFILLLLWTFPWKVVALWRSAKNSHKWWFLSFFILNTLGFLEIFYIFFISKKVKKAGTEKKIDEKAEEKN